MIKRPVINLTTPLTGCEGLSMNLTVPQITAGSDTGLHFDYFINLPANIKIPDPTAVKDAGTYMIRGTSSLGCTNSAVLKVELSSFDVIGQAACDSVDLTAAGVVTVKPPGTIFSYWHDTATTIPLINPQKITVSGIYYIKGTMTAGCSVIRPVPVRVRPGPVFTVVSPPAIPYPHIFDLTQYVSYSGTTTVSYWRDPKTTLPVSFPGAVTKEGTYYVKGQSVSGCTTVKPLQLSLIPPPPFTFNAPNAFSPNGDGINEEFTVTSTGLDAVTLVIYNRWGQEIFRNSGNVISWNGKCKNRLVPPGIYYYIFKGTDGYHHKDFMRSGSVTVIY